MRIKYFLACGWFTYGMLLCNDNIEYKTYKNHYVQLQYKKYY